MTGVIKNTDFGYDSSGRFDFLYSVVMTGSAFSRFSPSYVTTNEDLRMVFGYLNPANKRVLANTGSGDMPMFCRAYGAKHVDSFDISYCAKAMMDMKTAAVKHMDLRGYNKFIRDMYRNKDVADGVYANVVNDTPIKTRVFVNNMRGRAIFSNGKGVIEGALPQKNEYEKMKKNIFSPIPFIWSDLQNLHTKLNKQYDEMYLSNIFQYMFDVDSIVNVLNSLRPFLVQGGGVAVHTTCFFRSWEYDVYRRVAKQIESWGQMKYIRDKTQEMIVLQKIR